MGSCKGCDIEDTCTINITKDKKHHTELCPCQSCLVKLMCSVPCYYYVEWQHKIGEISTESFVDYQKTYYPDKIETGGK